LETKPGRAMLKKEEQKNRGEEKQITLINPRKKEV